VAILKELSEHLHWTIKVRYIMYPSHTTFTTTDILLLLKNNMFQLNKQSSGMAI
jgi:hypothetical protein